MTREELKKIAMRYAHNELKDSQSPIEDVVAAAFLDGIDYAGQHQWISVEDELPPTSDRDDESEDCLIVDEDGDMNVAYYNKMDKTWFSCDGYILGVTHWMPTPEAPSSSEFPNNHIIDVNKKVDRVIGTADHIKTALDVLNKKGGEE